MTFEQQFNKLAGEVREAYDADLIVYFGPIERPKDDYLISESPKSRKRKNVLLCISTLGGNPHAAYRIARTLQSNYSGRKGGAKPDANQGKVFAFVVGVCGSAGTLLVLGADELILSDHAELGPIDVQLRRQEEVGERTSVLTPVQALDYLRAEGIRLFRDHFEAMRFQRDNPFPTSVASRVAAEITAGCLGKLYEQIDPLRVAEINRTLQISEHYGRNIARNLKRSSPEKDALQRLLRDYPSHDSVIDPVEARELFETVSDPKPPLAALGVLLKPIADLTLNSDDAYVSYIEEPPNEANDDTNPSPEASGAPVNSNGSPVAQSEVQESPTPIHERGGETRV